MARVKITLPKAFLFETKIRVRIDDINYGGHLGNERILSFSQEARVQFLKSSGFTELDFGGVGLIMTEAMVSYKAESFQNDVLTVRLGVDEVSKMGFDFVYEFVNQEGALIALAKTGMMAFNYDTRKIASLPSAAKTLFNG